MLGYSILSNLFTNIIATKFVNSIYHSVVIESKDGERRPVASIDGKYRYVGIQDNNGFSCYCRQIGPAEVQKTFNVAACGKNITRFQVPHRIIFFNANEERNHEDILAKLIGVTMGSYRITISRINNIREDLLRQEVPTGRFNFTENTFYQGIDFFVLLDLQTDNCEQEIRCDGLRNPFCGITD